MVVHVLQEESLESEQKKYSREEFNESPNSPAKPSSVVGSDTPVSNSTTLTRSP